jgi:hypothetical protein
MLCLTRPLGARQREGRHLLTPTVVESLGFGLVNGIGLIVLRNAASNRLTTTGFAAHFASRNGRHCSRK